MNPLEFRISLENIQNLHHIESRHVYPSRCLLRGLKHSYKDNLGMVFKYISNKVFTDWQTS